MSYHHLGLLRICCLLIAIVIISNLYESACSFSQHYQIQNGIWALFSKYSQYYYVLMHFFYSLCPVRAPKTIWENRGILLFIDWLRKKKHKYQCITCSWWAHSLLKVLQSFFFCYGKSNQKAISSPFLKAEARIWLIWGAID